MINRGFGRCIDGKRGDLWIDEADVGFWRREVKFRLSHARLLYPAAHFGRAEVSTSKENSTPCT
jgi:hypothetical protein